MKQKTSTQHIRAIYLFPFIFEGLMNQYNTMFFLNSIVEQYQVDITRLGIWSSIDGTLSLFIGFITSMALDYIGNTNTLLFGAPLVGCGTLYLYYPSLWKTPFLSRLSLMSKGAHYVLMNTIRSIIPISAAYKNIGMDMARMLEKRNDDSCTDEMSVLLAQKQYVDLVSSMVGSFLPSIIPDTILPFYHGFILLGYVFSYLLVYVILSRNRLLIGNTKQTKVSLKLRDASHYVSTMVQLFSNPAWLMLLCLFCYEALRSLLFIGTQNMFFVEVLGLKSNQSYAFWLGIYHTIGLFMGLISTTYWLTYAKKTSIHHTWLVAYLCQIPIGLIVYAFCRGESSFKLYFYGICTIINSMLSSGTSFLLDNVKIWVYNSMELQTGSRPIAMMEMLWDRIPKLFSLPGQYISSLLLVSVFGFVTRNDTSTLDSSFRQSSLAIEGISFLAAAIPSLSALGCLFIMSRFPLNDQTNQVIKSRLSYRESNSKDQPKALTVFDHFFSFERRSLFLIHHAYIMEWIYFGFWLLVLCLSVVSFLLYSFHILSLWIAVFSFFFLAFHACRLPLARQLSSL